MTALGGSERAGQQEMAAAVDRAAERGEHLMVQAGTGTGKSLAYLVPLAAHAVRTATPVVVSTATLALQRQIAERDLPRLSTALSPLLGRQLTSAVVKGRSQYVCVNKLAGGMGEPADADTLFEVAGSGDSEDGARTSSLGRQVRRAREWAEQSETGDRDDLVPGVPDRAWRQVSVTARECLGAARCPMAADCHVEQGRARAREVDVVVTNHALLAVDAVEGRAILPEHDVVVIDEAHELAARVTSVAAVTLSGSAVAAAAASARRHGGSAETLEVAGDDLVAVLADAEPGRLAAGLGETLGAAVAAVRDAARSALSSLSDGGGGGAGGGRGGRGSGGGGSDGPDAGGVSVARAGLTEVFETAERLVAVQARGHDVAWVERTERGGAPTSSLHVAPLSVAAVLRERLFGTRTVVMTSATLALGGAFTSSAANVGMTVAPATTDGSADADAETDPTTLRALEVESPFDYPRQGILYVAAHLPPPGRTGTDPAVLDELEALITAAGGRTLALFSSRRAAESAAEAMRPRLAMPVLCQGDDATPTLVRDFLADEETCLFGTLSLWQGVDAPGPSCQLVVIDRIPFPRPDDPLTAARTEAVGRAGGNGFMAVAATHAALLLAQGSGRLVRSSDDRGVVAVLDPRLANARYGAFLKRSMPPLWPTTDRAVALGALQRLAAAAKSAG